MLERNLDQANKKVKIRCNFLQINTQLPVSGYSAPLRSIHYWAIEVYIAQYFDDFIYHSLK